jgi:hypothetical protein
VFNTRGRVCADGDASPESESAYLPTLHEDSIIAMALGCIIKHWRPDNLPSLYIHARQLSEYFSAAVHLRLSADRNT